MKLHHCFRMLSFVVVLLGLTALSLVLGCNSSSDKSIPVTGKVTLEGEPLKAGSVTFIPDTDKGNTSGFQPVGEIDEHGNYTLSTRNTEGAPAGWYKVTIHASVPSNPKNPYSVPRSLINTKYEDSKTTPLSVEVVKDASEGAYDLKVAR